MSQGRSSLTGSWLLSFGSSDTLAQADEPLEAHDTLQRTQQVYPVTCDLGRSRRLFNNLRAAHQTGNPA